MRTGLKKFIGVTAVSGMLGGGAVSVGVSAVTDDVETKMNNYVEYIYLVDKILSTPPSQLNKYNAEMKRLYKATNGGPEHSFWNKHYAEREEWKKANNRLNDLELKIGQLDAETYGAYDEWFRSLGKYDAEK